MVEVVIHLEKEIEGQESHFLKGIEVQVTHDDENGEVIEAIEVLGSHFVKEIEAISREM